MKSISLLIFLILITVGTLAQQSVIDSLKRALSRANNDSTKFCLSIQVGELYGFNNADSLTFRYYKYAMATMNSLFHQEKIQQMHSITFKEELRERQRQQQALLKETEYRNKIKIYVVLGFAIAFLSIANILWNFNKQKQKANLALDRKNKQIEMTLSELKSTQAQLIQ